MTLNSERLRNSLQQPDSAHKLRAMTLELANEGCSKQEITTWLEELLQDLRDRPGDREAEEDAVLDVLDGLAGWCQAEGRLLPGGKVQ